jgi:hypothetical protein
MIDGYRGLLTYQDLKYILLPKQRSNPVAYFENDDIGMDDSRFHCVCPSITYSISDDGERDAHCSGFLGESWTSAPRSCCSAVYWP